ncbi:hypothetical protein DSL72_000075 [Monilinia vaccinii-corymbosi]|uniref:Uncharacterized protein n=1 Tax=Monilinia vaccinii-corymbosi TaxID=61207 RepID=A0A8A3P5S4_9HELO|nr:hypothetical protein DSL72_000075 [Monilinia vaccinii-corymbosi]
MKNNRTPLLASVKVQVIHITFSQFSSAGLLNNMSGKTPDNSIFWFDPNQELEQANLHSPVFPDVHQSLAQDHMSYEDFLNNSEVMVFPQANEKTANIEQANHTQVELPIIPLIADNSANPQLLNNDFLGSNLFPAPAVFEGSSNTLPVNITQPVPEFPGPFDFPETFRHDILNAFPNPRYPLQIIDSFEILPGHVLEALHQGLKRQREHDKQISQLFADANMQAFNLEHSPAKKRKNSGDKVVAISIAEDLALSGAKPKQVPEPEPAPAPAPATEPEPEVLVRPIKVPGKKWIKPNSTTQGKNNRSKNIQSLKPSNFYQPLAQRPQSWGTPNRAGVPPFQYTAEGELKPHIKLTSAQMKEFIFNHPGHTTVTGERHTKSSGLTLWIQSVPSDSAARYPHQNSDKCRFEDCPVRNGTIHKGHYRVALDEQSSDPVVTDPFHNAGHVHLYCLEKFLDFPIICANFNVRPDDRILPEGRNKMAITRDHAEMKRIVKRFIRNAEKDYTGQSDDVYEPSYEDTLSFKLTVKHLKLEPSNRQRLRDRRPNANSMDKHLNNLDLFVAGHNYKRNASRPARNGSPLDSVGQPAPVRSPANAERNKRKAGNIDEDEDGNFEIDDEMLDADSKTSGQRESSTKQSKDRRPVKRARTHRKSIKKVVEIDSDSDSSSNTNNSSDDGSASDSDFSDWQPKKRSRVKRSGRESIVVSK